jgi:hypothetical protein
MVERPTRFGTEIAVQTVEDVDAALHEMAWLAAKQKSIEADAEARIETIKTETNDKLVTKIDGAAVSIEDRWNALHAAVHTWCTGQLKQALPPGKKSLKLSHGEIKLRALAAAVEVLKGKNGDDVAFDLARRAEILDRVDKLLQTQVEGIPLAQLVAVKFVLDKDQIKDEWIKRPANRELLRSLSISVIEGTEQITVIPAAVQVATTA